MYMVNHDQQAYYNVLGGDQEYGADHDKKIANIGGKEEKKSGPGETASRKTSPGYINGVAKTQDEFLAALEYFHNSLFEEKQSIPLVHFLSKNVFSLIEKLFASWIKWKELSFGCKEPGSSVSQKSVGYLVVPDSLSHMIYFVTGHSTAVGRLLSKLPAGIADPETPVPASVYGPTEITLVLKKIWARMLYTYLLLGVRGVSGKPKKKTSSSHLLSLAKNAKVYVHQFNSLDLSTRGKFFLYLSGLSSETDVSYKRRRAYDNLCVINEVQAVKKIGQKKYAVDVSTKKRLRRKSYSSQTISNLEDTQIPDQPCTDSFVNRLDIRKLCSAISESVADDTENGRRMGNATQETQDISDVPDTRSVGEDLADVVKRVSTRSHAETQTPGDTTARTDNRMETWGKARTDGCSEGMQEGTRQSGSTRNLLGSLLRLLQYLKPLLRYVGSRGELRSGRCNPYRLRVSPTLSSGRQFGTERVNLQKLQTPDAFTLDIKGGDDERHGWTARDTGRQRSRVDQATQTDATLEELDEHLSHGRHQSASGQDHSSDITPAGVEDYRILLENIDDGYSESEMESFVSSQASGCTEASGTGFHEEFCISDKPKTEDKPSDSDRHVVSNSADSEDDSDLSADGSQCECALEEDSPEALDSENQTVAEKHEDSSAQQETAVKFSSPVQASSPTGSEYISEYSEWRFHDWDANVLPDLQRIQSSRTERGYNSFSARLYQTDALFESADVADTASVNTLAVSATETHALTNDAENYPVAPDDDYSFRRGDHTPVACTEDLLVSIARDSCNVPYQPPSVCQEGAEAQCCSEKDPENCSLFDSKHSKRQSDDQIPESSVGHAQENGTEVFPTADRSSLLLSQESGLGNFEEDPENSSPDDSKQPRHLLDDVAQEVPIRHDEETTAELCPTPVYYPLVMSQDSGLSSFERDPANSSSNDSEHSRLYADDKNPETVSNHAEESKAELCPTPVSITSVLIQDSGPNSFENDCKNSSSQDRHYEDPEDSADYSEGLKASVDHTEVPDGAVGHAEVPEAPDGHAFSMANRDFRPQQLFHLPFVVHQAGAPPPRATPKPILDISQGAEPAMSRLSTRRGTYHRVWPANSGQDPAMLSQCGFYYTGRGRVVRCWWCGVHLCLGPVEDPWETHKRCSPHCQYLTETREDHSTDGLDETKRNQ